MPSLQSSHLIFDTEFSEATAPRSSLQCIGLAPGANGSPALLPSDVKTLDTDALLCSPYKWFGPHMGLIYLKKEHVDRIDFNNAKADDIAEGARQFHMGTPQYEHLCGCEAAVDFIASIGNKYAECFAEELKGL